MSQLNIKRPSSALGAEITGVIRKTLTDSEIAALQQALPVGQGFRCDVG